MNRKRCSMRACVFNGGWLGMILWAKSSASNKPCNANKVVPNTDVRTDLCNGIEKRAAEANTTVLCSCRRKASSQIGYRGFAHLPGLPHPSWCASVGSDSYAMRHVRTYSWVICLCTDYFILRFQDNTRMREASRRERPSVRVLGWAW